MEVTLESTQEKFADWRQSNAGKRQQIPDELWREAGSHSANHSWNKIAKALRLNPTTLKQRTTGVTHPNLREKTSRQPDDGFVEFNLDSLLTPPYRSLVLLTSTTGDRVKIETTGPLDIPALCRAILSRSS